MAPHFTPSKGIFTPHPLSAEPAAHVCLDMPVHATNVRISTNIVWCPWMPVKATKILENARQRKVRG